MSPTTVPDVLAPARLGPVEVRNRIVKSATFEGRTPDALVTDDLIEFHREIAAGGVGMSTVAYLAVAPGGRTDRHQIWLRDEARPGLERLTAAIAAEGAVPAAQIGHAGPVANAASNREKALAPSRFLAPMGMSLCKKPSVREIKELVEDYRRAVRIAVDSGFRGLELHFGHNYLASSFLSPLVNRRRDEYGGSLENRARFCREIAEAVREEVDGEAAVWAKLSMYDGVPGGFTIEESVQVARWLEEDGTLDAIEPTAGSSLLNPMYLFHGDAPVKDFANAFKGPLRIGMKAFGPFFLRKYPYRDGYLMDLAKNLREAVDLPLILVGGITDRASMDAAMEAGFDFVAMGRTLIREPDLVNRIAADSSVKSTCTHCNLCMPTIYSRDGAHCPVPL